LQRGEENFFFYAHLGCRKLIKIPTTSVASSTPPTITTVGESCVKKLPVEEAKSVEKFEGMVGILKIYFSYRRGAFAHG